MPHHHSRKRHQQRDDLTGEYAVGDAGQLLLACLFAVTWIADTFFFNYTTFLNKYMPLIIRIPSGIILLALSSYLAYTGLSIIFSEEREKPGVVREGVFNIIRHPIYLSEILLYLGLLMFNISLVAVAVWVMAIIFFHFIARYEEKLLLARFGKQYEQYMREVPMWFPRFRKR